MKKVAVIGGGFAGMAVEYELVLNSCNHDTEEVQVTVLERNDSVGGRIWTLNQADGTPTKLRWVVSL